MDRRPIRSATAGGPRRALFPAPGRRQNPSSAPPSIPAIPTDYTDVSAKEDLVDKDEHGNYIVAAPSAQMKLSIRGGLDALEEESEQEKQLISMYEKHMGNSKWDDPSLLGEIKAALDSRLRQAVKSLDEDRWMFEGE
ncbi:hypothetical protein BS50DRAFT_570442 [Corynespora cassiicola Philippines]|uniref:Uncharacterized protein n=1 Tax=Corynespora cassiicola Philippines TaxID=1448308 RepID=A0A2T2P036_CORCC|nr:hypothetical protein BS50DRAFT_570442 [Corynespora cassiicola Philippines]